MFLVLRQGRKIRSSFWLLVLEDGSHSTLLKLFPHTQMHAVDVPNSKMSQGYKVMTSMVIDDVDAPSHRPNSLKERTSTHKHTQSKKYVNVMVTAGSSG